GGCSGNLQAISSLCKGQKIDDIITKLKGIQCRNNTSCPDQLAIALQNYKEEHNI
ncbi:MAG: TSCPD domain-containing protein, partial [Clostridia bacterium]